MTALKREAIQLVEQMPEEQIAYIIQYIHMLKGINVKKDSETVISPRMQAFQELEQMLVPVPQELDYDKELAESREERYGNFD